MARTIDQPTGKLGVLLPGLGAVSTTFIAGVLRIIQKSSLPIGSLTQMGTVRCGKRTEKRHEKVSDLVPLASLDDLVFGGWDIYDDDCYSAALNAGVLKKEHLDSVRERLETIVPMSACFDRKWVRNLDGPNVKNLPTKWDMAQALMDDIRGFIDRNNCNRAVAVWCGSTEVHVAAKPVHLTLEDFERGLKENNEAISPSMIYAYAHLKLGIPYANGAPHLSVDMPALEALATANRTPIAGKDFKTGQTLMKTILAPGFKARLLGLNGWFSTNILGNRDGEVLDDPGSFKSKEVSKLSVLDTILRPEENPDLYGDLYHKVRINFYPPRGDNKEGWDNIDIFGWLGYPMQLKVNFLCRDSILAAPIVLDLALFMDLAKRAGFYGIQEWLSFYFKSPHVGEGLYPQHDLFKQLSKLENTLRHLAGETLITHLGLDYYYDD